ncbi:F-box protein SKIP2-like [Aristolochia californica]|uniref:F-box protein SKIP2-like n=1 Tax=Aristolochia californica TaxID=171875 RepID=UPI0035DE7A6B
MGQGSSSSSTPKQGTVAIWRIREGGDLTLSLPDECLSAVFAKLGCQDRNACSLVCKRWNLVDAQSRQRLVLVARSDLSPLLPALISRFSAVSALSLKCSRKLVSVDDNALSHLARGLPSLSKLKLKGCVDLSDEGLSTFSLLCPSLSKLSCASCSFAAKGVNSILTNCPRLQDLTLKRLRKLDAHNIPLGQSPPQEDGIKQSIWSEASIFAPCLERLCLKDLHNARHFAPLLRAAKALKTLIVCRSSGSWDPVLENLSTSLTDIQVENVQLSDNGLVAISSACHGLEVLYISRVSDCSDAGFSALAASCRKLRKIHIDAWSKFGNLNFVGDNGVMSMSAKCPNLQEVVLMGIPITVLSLNALASNCLALERMALCNTDSVGDSELGLVAAKFSALKKLCIKNCPISDLGIDALVVGCPNLVKLKVKRCRGVTQASVSRLRSERKSLVASVDPGSFSFEEDEMGIEEEPAIAEADEDRGRPRRYLTTTTTHLVCGSRGASFLRSKLRSGKMLRRRPSLPSTSHPR